MKSKPEKRIVSVEISIKDLNEIDSLAKKSQRSRSDMLRILLGMGLDDVKLLNSVGLFTALNLGLDIFDRFKTALKDGDVHVEDGKANFPLS